MFNQKNIMFSENFPDWDYFLNRLEFYRADFFSSALNPSFGYNFIWWFIGLYCLYISLEVLFSWRKKQKRFREGFLTDLFYTFFNLVFFWWFLGYAINDYVAVTFNNFLLNNFGVENLVMIELDRAPDWMQYCILFLLFDFLTYWVHRLSHNVSFLWQLHKVHHSSKEIDVFNAMRSHFLDLMIYPFLLYLPMSLFGYSIREFYTIYLVSNFLTLGLHANIPLSYGPLKYLLNNPKLHLWHHMKVLPNGKTSVNYGNALSVWDYLFNTAYYNDDVGNPSKLGFDEIEAYPQTIWGQWAAPFKRYFRINKKKK